MYLWEWTPVGGHDGAVAADHHDGGGATAGKPCTGGFG